MLLAEFEVAPEAFLAVVGIAAVAGTLAAVATARGLLIPTVVAELVLGVVIGPEVLGIEVTEFMEFFASLGLGMLFFFAGYEIDIRRIAGLPLRLAVVGWLLSLTIAYGLGGLLAAAGIVLSLVYTGSALATTAIGTLIPVLSDSGELRTRFGGYLLAAGAVGEFGPILLLTLLLSSQGAAHNAAILAGFVGLAVAGRTRSPCGRPRTPCRCSCARSNRVPSWPCAGSSCSCSRSRCWRPSSASTCCSADSRPV